MSSILKHAVHRVAIPSTARPAAASTSTTDILSFLVPCIYRQCQGNLPRARQSGRIDQQYRSASILANLRDNPGAVKAPRRLGRGPSSGRGKTSTRGHKGQKQHGKVPFGFIGGQTSLNVQEGKVNQGASCKSVEYSLVNLSRISSWVSQGRLDPRRPITPRELLQSRCVSTYKHEIKLLAQGSDVLTKPLHIVVSRASKNAIQAVEKAGGSVLTRYYTPFAQKMILRGKMDPLVSLQSDPASIAKYEALRHAALRADNPIASIQPRREYLYRLPDPASRADIEYYRHSDNRGYLAHTVAADEDPSLFWKSAVAMTSRPKTKVAGKVGNEGANRIWA